MRYLEDMVVGERASFGHYVVNREEVLDFARRYDPQPFHLDDAAAASHPFFERLAASGWHTCAMAMRMMVDYWRETGIADASLGSPGVDRIRWLRPVYPGDVLRMESEIIEVQPSTSRPDRGSVGTNYVVLNQKDEPVMRFTGIGLFSRRPTAEG